MTNDRTTDAERIGTAMRTLRVQREMSLQDVADRAGLSKSRVWELENGARSNPSLATLRALADCFGVSLSYMLGDAAEDVRLHPVALQVAIQVDDALRRAADAE